MTAPAGLLAAAVRRLHDQIDCRISTGVRHDDADDVLGTVATDDAIGFDPFPLLGALAGHGARVVVMGQVAGILHGSTELTGDLDLLWDGDAAQHGLLAAAFADVGAVLTADDGMPVRSAAFGIPKVLFRSASASGDLCAPSLPWGDLPVRDYLQRACVCAGPDGPISYVALPDLIAMRRAVGRPKDLRRAAELERLLVAGENPRGC